MFDSILSGLKDGDLQTVKITGRYQRDIIRDYWDPICMFNMVEPSLFRRGGRLVQIDTDDAGAPQIIAVTRATLRDLVDRTSNSVRTVRNGQVPAHPRNDNIEVMLDEPDPRVPVLRGLTSTPVYVPPGDLLDKPGYDEQSGLYLCLRRDLAIPPVSVVPRVTEIEEANRLLTVELIGDFPFVSQSDVTAAVSILLTPFVRPMVAGPTPPFLITAPTPGTGKSKLAEALMVPASGTPPETIPQARSEDEMARKILGALKSGPTSVLIDNITGSLDSGALSSAFTSTYWTDRVVGTPDNLAVPVQCVWLLTANNPSLSPELARRMAPIRLDRGVEKPWLHTGFRHPDLLGWARQNRARLIWAALTILQAAKANGWPKSAAVFGSYERWAELVGGAVENAGLKGFLENRDEAFEAFATGETDWKLFVAEWHREFGSDPVDARTLCQLAVDKDLLLTVLAGREPAKAVFAIGKEISNRADARFGEFTIRRLRRDRNGSWLYQALTK